MVQHLQQVRSTTFELPEGEEQMSKRSRRTKAKTQPTDESLVTGAPGSGASNSDAPVGEARPADHGQPEASLVLSGVAFQKFDEWIDGQLEEIVGRWIHTAAPAASAIRRVVPQTSRESI
jgi:hypothetical protein